MAMEAAEPAGLDLAVAGDDTPNSNHRPVALLSRDHGNNEHV